MGKSYEIPRNVKGESRILYVFSVKSLLTTAGGLAFGVVFYFILSLVGLKSVGFITMIILGVIGYLIGALTIPDVPFLGPIRKASGESVLNILIRAVTFPKRKKLFIYKKGWN